MSSEILFFLSLLVYSIGISIIVANSIELWLGVIGLLCISGGLALFGYYQINRLQNR